MPRRKGEPGVVYVVEKKVLRGWDPMFDVSLVSAQEELEWYMSHVNGNFRITKYVRVEDATE